MGIYLSSPVTSKRTECGITGSRLEYSISCMQGWRSNMEDTHIALPSLNIDTLLHTSLFAVFDGHGGKFCSDFAHDKFLNCLKDQEEYQEYSRMQTDEERDSAEGILLLRKALRGCFIELDTKLFLMGKMNSCTVSKGDSSGCTALVLIITPKNVICANAGDSRAVLTKLETTDNQELANKKLLAIPLSHDHRPTCKTEKERIKEAGGIIYHHRVGGDLAVSRGLGDFRFKKNLQQKNPEDQIVTCVPEITVKPRSEVDQFILLGCDGIWDIHDKKNLISRVAYDLDHLKKDLTTVCEGVLDLCLEKGSKDNMTAIIVVLPGMNAKNKIQHHSDVETGDDEHSSARETLSK